MSEEIIQTYFVRIDKLQFNTTPFFGKMSANQMICHCTDHIHLALNTIKAEEFGGLKPKEVKVLAAARKTIPVAKGIDQLEGGGTAPTTFKNDKALLKQHILKFSKLKNNFIFGANPYFGDLNREKWTRLTFYHLNHYLAQFKV